MNSFFINFGFIKVSNRSYCYCLKNQGLFYVFLTLYINDLLFFNKELKVIERMKLQTLLELH